MMSWMMITGDLVVNGAAPRGATARTERPSGAPNVPMMVACLLRGALYDIVRIANGTLCWVPKPYANTVYEHMSVCTVRCP